MKFINVISLLLVLTSCSGSSSTESENLDAYFGVWHAPCSEGDQIYYVLEYVISESEIGVNVYFYSDADCFVLAEPVSFLHVADIEDLEYEVINTRSGYEARWYSGYVHPIDRNFDPSEYEIGFYLDGDTLYSVLPYSEGDDFGVIFDEFYSRQ